MSFQSLVELAPWTTIAQICNLLLQMYLFKRFLFKPISMSFRHFGNVLSGMVISSLVYAALILANNALFGLIPGVVGEILGDIPFLAVGVPAVLSLYFDWFSSAMQAFIFCMLTMIFIRTAAE